MQVEVKTMKKVIIVGSGIAGLSAGCYLQMNGYDTQIFEAHNHPGGVCTSWTRKGYTVDNCIHWLVGSLSEKPAWCTYDPYTGEWQCDRESTSPERLELSSRATRGGCSDLCPDRSRLVGRDLDHGSGPDV